MVKSSDDLGLYLGECTLWVSSLANFSAHGVDETVKHGCRCMGTEWVAIIIGKQDALNCYQNAFESVQKARITTSSRRAATQVFDLPFAFGLGFHRVIMTTRHPIGYDFRPQLSQLRGSV